MILDGRPGDQLQIYQSVENRICVRPVGSLDGLHRGFYLVAQPCRT